MTARQSEKIYLTPESVEPSSNGSPSTPVPMPRVLSVSPRDHEEGQEPFAPTVEPDNFITPRTIDHQPNDEIVASMRELIAEASVASSRLTNLIEQTSDSDAWANKASVHLQERLRLSARMLKAFQTQVDRVEGALERAGSREEELAKTDEVMNEAYEKFENHICSTIERYERRMKEITDRSIERFDRHIADQRDDLERIEKQTAEAMKSSESAMKIAEEVESEVSGVAIRVSENMRAMDLKAGEVRELNARIIDELSQTAETHHHRVQQTVGDLDETIEKGTAGVRELLGKCDEASKLLVIDLADSRREIEESAVRCRGIRCALETKLDQCRDAETAFQKKLEETTELVSSLEIDARTYEKLQKVLDRLEPWKNLLLRETGDQAGLPEPVAHMVDQLREGVGRDMSRISQTLTDIVGRIESSGITGHLPSRTTELKPHTAEEGQVELVETVSLIERTERQIADAVARKNK